jgi:hypothetical protein
MRRHTAAALTLLGATLLGATASEGRSSRALQCESRVGRVLARAAAQCHRADANCDGRARGILREKLVDDVPPPECLPRLCREGDAVDRCADRLIGGSGTEGVGSLWSWSRSDQRCALRTSDGLRRLARKIALCERRAGAAAAACLDTVTSRGRRTLEGLLVRFGTKGAMASRCLPGACARGDDVATCLDGVLTEPMRTGDRLGGSEEPSDLTQNEATCRTSAARVLQEFVERVAKCRRDDEGRDLIDCILEARGKREEKLIGLLEKRVRPEVCLPEYCTPDQSPEACAAAALDALAPESAQPPAS